MNQVNQEGTLNGKPAEGAVPRASHAVPMWRRVAWVPLPAVIVAIIILLILDIRTVFDPPLLMPAVNAVIFVGASILAAYLAARGYLTSGVHSVLFLGCGMLTFGMACLVGSVQVSLGRLGAGVASHNIGALVSGGFHLVGAFGMLFFGVAPRPRESRGIFLLSLYAFSLAVVGAVTALAWHGLLPDFVTSTGTTHFRSAVLTITVAEYMLGAFLFRLLNRMRKNPFLQWYRLGLGLIGLGFAAVGLARIGSPLSWTGRASQSLGQIYFLICLLTAAKDFCASEARVDRRIGASFQQIELEHRAIVEASADGIWVADFQGYTIYANQRMAEMLACSAEELVGKPISEFFSPQIPGTDWEEINRRLKQENQRELEILFRRKDGTEFWSLVNSSIIKNGRGHPTSILGMVSDITERKRTEISVLKQREWLRVTLTSIGDAVMTADTDGRTTFLNPVAAALTGWKPEEALDQPIQDVFRTIDEETHGPAENIIERVLREGHGAALASRTALVTRDGRQIPIEDSAAPIRDSAGNVSGVVLVFHDETEKRRAQEALRENELKYRSLFEGMTEAFMLAEILLDEKGKPKDDHVLEVNRAFQTVTGISPSEAIGKTARQLFPDLETKLMERLGDVALTGQPLAFQSHSEGSGKWLEFYVFSPEKRRVGCLFLDITERKKAEQALRERTTSLQELTTTLELKVQERTAELTEMNQRLKDSERHLKYLSARLLEAQEEERRRIAGDVHDSFSASLSAVKYKIEFALKEVGDNANLKSAISYLQRTMEDSRRIQMALRPSILDDLGVLTALGWACREFERTYPVFRISSQFNVKEHEIPDPLKIVIFRISQEAFHNVSKHSQGNRVSLSLARSGSVLEMMIKDNGKGFDMGKVLSERGTQKGLGLSSMRERATLSGGTLHIESKPGKGTTIRVSWAVGSREGQMEGQGDQETR